MYYIANIFCFFVQKDYNASKLQRHQWVAVAYDQQYFIGQVKEMMGNKVRINFLFRKNNFYYWPQVIDKDDVDANFIFKPTVKVEQIGRKFKVHDVTEIDAAYKGFTKKYF